MVFVGNLMLFAAAKKNFSNRSRFNKVTAMIRVAPFFWFAVYLIKSTF